MTSRAMVTFKRVVRAQAEDRRRRKLVADQDGVVDDIKTRLKTAWRKGGSNDPLDRACDELFAQLVEAYNVRKKLRLDLEKVEKIELRLINRLRKETMGTKQDAEAT